ncbi:hypothetical protein QBC37DRAFT_379404 [Rhypophila decipiens]|uniref:Uncharacterized protein n=1 Tax=Rhypophila decipiens TaxID=261697 RepID=A0AAN6XWB7_9PEZI|nr:hypothetical protein QBC37DRAFT_379404 [Rhypophila decipiens]
MSVTDDFEKTVRICDFYYARRMKGIRILTVRTSGPGWKHWDMKMWDVEDLVKRLGLTRHEYFANEWLVENQIPHRAVVSVQTLEEMVHMAETMEGVRAEYILAKKLYERIKYQLAKIGKDKRIRERDLERIFLGERSGKRAKGFSSLSQKRN